MTDSNTLSYRYRRLGTIALSMVGLLAIGCKKSKYPPSCKQAVTLTVPWTELGLPTDTGRVCESGPDNAKYMFLDMKPDAATKLFEDALLAKGYTKDRCSSLACDYKGSADKIAVQPFEASGKVKYVTISLRKAPLRGGSPTTDTPTPTPMAASGGGDCSKIFERFAACEKIDAKVKDNIAQIATRLKSAPADKVKQMCDTMSAGWEKTLAKAGC